MVRDASQHLARKRVAILLAIVLVWVTAIVARLVQLQVVQFEEHAAYARSQQTRRVKLVAPRGAIYDRAGNPLAVSLEHESIAINPMRIPNVVGAAGAAELLAGALGVNRAILEQKIKRYQDNRRGFLWIRRWASPADLTAVRKLNADWIEYYKESKRHYPKRELASHVLGSVGIDGDGLFGIEQSMQYLLQSKDGNETVLQDVRRRAIHSEVTEQSQPGISVRLTLDQRIQSAAETALRKAIQQYRVPSGSVVVMDPNSGDILALANYPDFDPNVSPRTTKELEARMNRAVSLEYEPGSVFKIITLAAGLERTRLRPDTIIPCGNGVLRLPGRTIHDAHPYSALSFADVLAKSSNIGAIYVATAVGKEMMYDYVRAFGFGSKTGLPLPYEQSGYVWPMHQASAQKVYGSILASVAMGHQVSATTVQLAQACSVIANGGTLVRPRLVMELRAPDGKVTPLEGKREARVLRPETAITMRRLMEGVMLTGTGKGARLKGWTSGGKTGTAQIFDLKLRRYVKTYNSSFLGFAPLQNPSIVVVVTLNETRLYGGVIAGPVFQEVAAETLRILGVPMDSPQTVLARNVPPQLDDVKEGDAGLDGETSARMDAKLPPDTRKELMAMLSAAMKEDPEIEEWMLGNPRERIALSLPAMAPISVSATPALEEPQPLGVADADAASERDVAADTERTQREFEDSGRLVPVTVADNRAGAVTVVHLDTMLAPDFLGKSMREVMAEAMTEGVEVQVFGRGVARKQIPPAGTRMPRGVAVRVMFTP